MKIIAMGDNCIDHYVNQDRKYAGGCSVNFAVYAKQLGNESAYLGVVGDDENGKIICDTLTRQGVDISHMHVEKGKTAVTKVELSGGERVFSGYDEGVLSRLRPSEEDYAYIEQFDLLHTSVFGNAADLLLGIKGKVRICCDLADKWDHPDHKKLLELADYAFFSYDKDDDYIRKYLKDTCEHGTLCAVATLGKQGSIGYDGNTFSYQESKRVDVVDTIGAGDSFIAGFMSAIGEGADISGALNAGADKAAETIGHFGAF